MAKKPEMLMVTEIQPYEGMVRTDFLNAAKQSSSFLNERVMLDTFGQEMLKADLIATGKHAIAHEIGGRTIAARIRDEASRIYGENEVTTWFR